MKKISANDSVYKIATAYPEIIDLMVKLGFSDIVRPGMLHTAGRAVTLNKGAKLRNIDMAKIKELFSAEGFEIDEEA